MKTKTINLQPVRVSESFMSQLKKCVSLLGESESEYIRQAILEKNVRVMLEAERLNQGKADIVSNLIESKVQSSVRNDSKNIGKDV